MRKSSLGVVAAVAFVGAASVSTMATADIASDLSSYVGYTIVASKRVDHWVNSEKTAKNDGFEGCDYGRYIVFTDDTYLRCRTYHYHYAYRPEAVILSDGTNFIMIIDDDIYEMTRS